MELLLGHEFYRYSYENLWGSKLGMASYFTNQTLAGAIKLDSTGESGNGEYESEGSSSVASMTTTKSTSQVFPSVVMHQADLTQTTAGQFLLIWWCLDHYERVFL